MDTKRETKEFTTSGGHVIVHKTYLTGREFNEIQAVLMKDIKIDAIGASPQIQGFNAAAIEESNKKMLELVVVSVDGKTENVADLVLDLPYQETQEVTEALDAISGKKKASA